MSVIAPTGAGKSTFLDGIIMLRRYALGLDPKGGDETLNALGWPRLPRWPGRKKMAELVADNDEHGRPSRYIVGQIVESTADLAALRQTLATCLQDIFDMGRWTVLVDELQLLTDRRMMDLSGPVARILVAARSKKLTLVSAFQTPSWVPTEAIRQPYWIATSYTRDTDTVNRMAEVMGRPKPELRGAVKGLPDYYWLIVGRSPREPMILTKPPYIEPKRAA